MPTTLHHVRFALLTLALVCVTSMSSGCQADATSIEACQDDEDCPADHECRPSDGMLECVPIAADTMSDDMTPGDVASGDDTSSSDTSTADDTKTIEDTSEGDTTPPPVPQCSESERQYIATSPLDPADAAADCSQECGPNSQCVFDCMGRPPVGNGLSADCIDCYVESVECALQCTECLDSWGKESCFACLAESGCTSRFYACTGLQPCDDGATRACRLQMGVCQIAGEEQECIHGIWRSCASLCPGMSCPYGPDFGREETANGNCSDNLDNDCDGFVDSDEHEGTNPTDCPQ